MRFARLTRSMAAILARATTVAPGFATHAQAQVPASPSSRVAFFMKLPGFRSSYFTSSIFFYVAATAAWNHAFPSRTGP
jgi:hypothetical protein